MSTAWTALSDDYQLSEGDQVRMSVSFTCAPLSYITAADINTFMSQQQSVKAVLDVQEGWVDSVTLGLSFACSYLVTLNPQAGVTPGALRADMYTALSQANATHTIKSDNILVGTIEKASNSIIPDAPKVTTTISLVAVALLAVVGLILFLNAKEIV